MPKGQTSRPNNRDEKNMLKSKGMSKIGKGIIATKAQARKLGAKPKSLTEATRKNLRTRGGQDFSNPKARLKYTGRK